MKSNIFTALSAIVGGIKPLKYGSTGQYPPDCTQSTQSAQITLSNYVLIQNGTSSE